MPIVGKQKRLEGRVMSQPNIPKLMLPSEFHPNGRIQIDPVTKRPVSPDRNVLYKKEINRRGAKMVIEVNGGHALKEGSVWRIALGGPSRYLWKFMRDQMHYKMHGSRSISAPKELMDGEMKEARAFVTYMKEEMVKGNLVVPEDFLNKKYDLSLKGEFVKINEKFYEWLAKQEKVELSPLTDVYAFLPV